MEGESMKVAQDPNSVAAVPLPPFDAGWAVFLDVDGTLLDLAERPEKVALRPGLIETIDALRRVAPVAFVSGRRIADLDTLFAPLRLPAAGQHGAERRGADGQVHRAAVAEAAFARARERVLAWTRDHPGVLLEDKGLSLALHYRGAPRLEAEAALVAREALLGLGEAFVLASGGMVLEIRPRGWDKGRAIAEFMREPPFAGRVPVFAGDDITDEDGFAAASRLGGHAIKVGEGPTVARWRLDDAMQVLDWLERYVQWFATRQPGD
jgi:trehalose 6-phosphate phosphatase